MTSNIQLYQGDCLDVMKNIPDKSVDLVLADPPYGTTACKWDSVIPLEPMWKELKRVVKTDGAIVMTASQPFTSILVSSNINQFKYCLVWEKERPSNPALANKRFMKWHEDICVFYQKQPTYNAQLEKRDERNKRNNKQGVSHKSEVYGEGLSITQGDGNKEMRNPSSVIKVSVQRGLHPTQKPVALMEYLIKTYSNEGDVVLDFTMGSGTTGLAAKNLNRNFIGIEKDEGYFKIAQDRIQAAQEAVL